MEIILATTNQGKIIEIYEILKQFPITLSSLNDYHNIPEIIEDGETFLDNALIKGTTIFRLLNKPTLADDSGLVIPALNGEPGVRSARYGCENEEKPNANILINRVLDKMKNIPIGKRKAYFKASVVVILNEETHFIAEGECHGEITFEPCGEMGFGYDPIFFLPNYNKTMAELTIQEKNIISHRGIALAQLKDKLSLLLKTK